MLLMLLNLTLCQDAVTAPPQVTQHLSEARLLLSQLDEDFEAKTVREYTVLLIDNYVKQVIWRSFFLQDLAPGESVLEARAKVQSDRDAKAVLIEDDLEGLLLEAKRHFPDDINIRFACAYYAFRGQCCIVKTELKYSDVEVLSIFREALSQGIATGTSAFALIEGRVNQAQKVEDDDFGMLAKAYELDPTHPDISGAMLEQLLLRESFETAIGVARMMYGAHDFLQQRLTALHGSARAFLGLKRYDDAFKAVTVGLKLAPDHGILWMIGLDAMRAANDQERYISLVNQFLESHSFAIPSFEVYYTYLVRAGQHPFDTQVAQQLRNLRQDNETQSVDLQVGLATLWLRLGDKQKAHEGFVAVWERLMDAEESTALIEMVEKGIKASETTVDPATRKR